MSAKKIHDGAAPRGGVVTVITFIVAAIGAIVVLAVVVGVTDAARRPADRRRAAERRARWEARQPQHQRGPDDWDDD